MVSTSTKTLFTKLKVLGAGGAKLELSNGQIHSLLQFSCSNLGWDIVEVLGISAVALPDPDYFKVDLDWFEQRDANEEIGNGTMLNAIQRGIDKNADFGLFIHNLGTLHKRRLKYRRILGEQPRPTMDQVGPRSLLEYGLIDAGLLASWMIWRKWIFDIDNRSGQETGYLFEPILASCIGGEPVGSKNSPVKQEGQILIGEEGWRHLEEKAGPIMAAFIDRYIKPPLKRMAGFDETKLLDIALSWDEDKIVISEPSNAYRINRRIQ